MLTYRIILVLTGMLFSGLIFMLPRSIEQSETHVEMADIFSDETIVNPHSTGFVKDEMLRKTITSLRRFYTNFHENKKSAILADSLAGLYKKAGLFDSAAWFAEKAASFFGTEESFKKAGDFFYNSHISSVGGEKEKKAEKARFYFTKVMEQSPQDLDTKTKIAMTYVSSSAPMRGVLMLREVLNEDSDNELALFNMALLSVRSGQYEKAIGRLEKLIILNPDHMEAHMLLGTAYFDTGDKIKAKKLFEYVQDKIDDPAVRAIAESYLGKLK